MKPDLPCSWYLSNCLVEAVRMRLSCKGSRLRWVWLRRLVPHFFVETPETQFHFTAEEYLLPWPLDVALFLGKREECDLGRRA